MNTGKKDFKESKEKLKELFELLEANKTEIDFDDDLSYDESGECDKEQTPSLCVLQILIYWRNAHYTFLHMHDDHPNIQFATKEEVLEFFKGYEAGNSSGCNIEHNERILTPEEKAYNVGVYLDCLGTISCVEKYHEAAIAPEQLKIKDISATA